MRDSEEGRASDYFNLPEKIDQLGGTDLEVRAEGEERRDAIVRRGIVKYEGPAWRS